MFDELNKIFSESLASHYLQYRCQRMHWYIVYIVLWYLHRMYVAQVSVRIPQTLFQVHASELNFG